MSGNGGILSLGSGGEIPTTYIYSSFQWNFELTQYSHTMSFQLYPGFDIYLTVIKKISTFAVHRSKNSIMLNPVERNAVSSPVFVLL